MSWLLLGPDIVSCLLTNDDCPPTEFQSPGVNV